MERYNKITVNGKRHKEHRFIWEQAYGPIPPGYDIHHKNGNGKDNRLENLQMLTHKDHVALHARLRAEGKDPVSEKFDGVAEDRERSKKFYHEHKQELSERGKKYRENHKEELRERSKEYRESHKEQVRAYMKEYYRTHKQEKAEYDKKYRELRGDEIKEKRKEYFEEYRKTHKKERHEKYAKNREEILRKQKEFRDAHREEVRIKDRLWRAIRKGKPSEVVDKIRKELEEVKAKNK